MKMTKKNEDDPNKEDDLQKRIKEKGSATYEVSLHVLRLQESIPKQTKCCFWQLVFKDIAPSYI